MRPVSPVVWATGLLIVFLTPLFFLTPPIPQDTEYYNFADGRTLFGVLNFWNVISNLPFLIFGAMGIYLCGRRGVFQFEYEKWPYTVFFTGSLLTAFGSAYFHLWPGTHTLLWDRLPMALLFMGFVMGTLSDHLSPEIGRRWLAPAVIAGVASVMWWYFTEQTGRGDLRPYAMVQFGPMIFLPVVLLAQRSRYGDGRWVWAALCLYLLAKVLELSDQKIFEAVGISGHTFKHFAGGVAVLTLAAMLRRRGLSGDSI